MSSQYGNYKHFHEQSFNVELNNELLKTYINNAELKECRTKNGPRRTLHSNVEDMSIPEMKFRFTLIL